MEVLSWGGLTLKVDGSQIYTFSDFEWTVGYTSKTKDVKKKKPKTTAKAPNLEQISFSVLLLASMGVDVQAQIEAWRTACNAGEANELLIGGAHVGDAGSTWRIKSLKVSDMTHDTNVKPTGAQLSISMDEVAGKPPKATNGNGGKKKRKKAKKKVPSSTKRPTRTSRPVEKYRDKNGNLSNRISIW
ncbi:phage tail protein [Bacillota bacterium Meth-B3]